MIPAPPAISVAWPNCHHLLSEEIPLATFFESLANSNELETAFALLALTDPLERQRLGEISLVSPEDVVVGPGADIIMGAFTHPTSDPKGTRFADTTCGAFYAARTLETAVRERAYHRAFLFASTSMPAADVYLRDYTVDVVGTLADALTDAARFANVYDPADYTQSQGLARELRSAGISGIAYASVRHPSGVCAAVWRPKILSNCVIGTRVTLSWDGSRIVGAATSVPLF